MKRIVILLLLAMAGTLAAQQAVYSKGLENKKRDLEQMQRAYYLGVHDNLDCWIMEGRRHVKQFVVTDHNLFASRVIDLPESNGTHLLTATMNDRHATVLVMEHVSKKQTVALRYTIYLDSMICGVADTVEVFNHEKKDRCFLWGATSPSGNHSALVGVVRHSDKQQYSARVVLMDSDMDREWDKDFALGTLHNVKVTDDGRIVTFGIEPEGEETHFVFNVVDRERADKYSVAAKCDPIKEMNLVTVNGKHAIAAGTFLSTEGKNRTGGVLALSFQLDSASLTGLTMRSFTNEDVNMFLNKDTKKVQRDLTVDHVRTLSTVATDYGAAVLVGRSYRTENVLPSGAAKKVCYASGLHCLAVDTLGNIKWVRNIRRSDLQKDSYEFLWVALHVNKDDVMILKSEHPKMPSTYEISSAARDCEMGDKSNIVLYTLHPDGEVQKLVVEPKTKHNVFRTIQRADGSVMVLTEDGSKVRLAKLTIRE